MKDLDVIVVNYRTPADLEGFIRSYDQHSGTFESTLYVVNVCPREADLEIGAWAVETGLNPTHHIVFDENVGYGRAVNHAASLGSSKVIAAFNADTRLTEGCLDECYKALHGNPSWGVVGPRQVDEQNRITHAGIFGTHAIPKHRAWHKKDGEGQYDDVLEAITVSGSAYFIKRRVWDDLMECPIYKALVPEAEGAFLPTPLFYEETWCSYHAFAHGHKVMYYGPAKMVHKWHESIRSNDKSGWANKAFVEARDLFRAACDAHGLDHD